MTLAKDLTGRRSGKLVALEPTGQRSRSKKIIWRCICDCGRLTEVDSSEFSYHAGPKSCGCSRRPASTYPTTHGESRRGKRSPEYKTWIAMRLRCNDPANSAWKWYGGRGIRVAPEWDASYEAFLRDMGRRPSPSHSIDRIDVNGDYAPGNCRWVTNDVQQNNRTNNRRGLVNGELLSPREISARFNVPYRTIHDWICAAGDGNDISDKLANHKPMPHRGHESKSILTSEA